MTKISSLFIDADTFDLDKIIERDNAEIDNSAQYIGCVK